MIYIYCLALLLLLPALSDAQWSGQEPAGSTQLSNWDMTSPAPKNGADIPYGNGWSVISGRTTAQSDGGDTVSPPGVMHMHYDGVASGTSPGTHYFNTGSRDAVFLGYDFMLSSNYSMSDGNKLTFIGAANLNWAAVTLLKGNGNGPYQMTVYFPNVLSVNNCHITNLGFGVDCPGTVHLVGNQGQSTQILPGVHYKVSYFVKRATCSTCQNGIIRVFLNGTKIIETLNANMPDIPIGIVELSPTYGATTAPNGQYIRFGHAYISASTCAHPCTADGGQPPLDNPPGPPGTVTGVTVTVQ